MKSHLTNYEILFFLLFVNIEPKSKRKPSASFLSRAEHLRSAIGSIRFHYRRFSLPTTRPQQETSSKSLRRMGGYLGFREIR